MNEDAAGQGPHDRRVRSLVERLREAGNDYTVAWGSGELYDEAADYIEECRRAAVSLEHAWSAAEAEREEAMERLSKAEHWAKHAMLMRSSQNDELLRILRGEA